ncbi:HAMP domain-containing sensor histidine kinase [Kribbella solani]|uniref:sensor histidine kinase n=1 Tax=Kribbella solani TaxID=236067 RepID=UPI0029B2C7E9|nr:HAMP domain-containing sensor histidine kinase [Kribbella solani]MDX3006580.1 HAMP domain-containing sensor histidine kinase [Kribbella solani]
MRRIADLPGADPRLHERIGLDGPPDEVTRLAGTFDLMLERLDRSFEGRGRFIANASRELRTPLTLNRTLLEGAVQRTDAPQVRELGETMLEINSWYERVIDGLPTLAKSDGELGEFSRVDLADVVTRVIRQRPGVIASASAAPTVGNAIVLAQLVHNLVENAVDYNVPGGWVRITTGTNPHGTVQLIVSNTGPTAPQDEVAGLFEPFRRFTVGRLSSRPGVGLGLTIVRAVAHAHGGT